MVRKLKKLRRWIFLNFPNSRIIATLLFYKFFGLDELDLKLRKHLLIKRGYFVELGANDGLKQSNTKHFELFRNWSGILIEPEPNNYRLLRRNRSSKSKFFNAACVSRDFPFHEITMMYSDLMTTPLEGRNEIENAVAHAALGESIWGGTSYEFKAPARTLSSILDEANAPSIMQLLSLDVEGAELEVLHGLDLERYSFEYMLIESRNLPTLQDFLKNNGYFLIEKISVHDFLFMKSRTQK